jgi:hypothetical protein
MCSIFPQCCAMKRPSKSVLGLGNMLSDIGTAASCGGTCATAVIDDRDQGLYGRSAPIENQISGLNDLTSSTSESSEQEHLDITDQEEASLRHYRFTMHMAMLLTGMSITGLPILSLNMPRAALFIYCTPICMRNLWRSAIQLWIRQHTSTRSSTASKWQGSTKNAAAVH